MRFFSLLGLIIIVSFASINSASALMLRETGEMDIGLIGGYGFPQLGFWNSRSAGNHMNKSADEYSFGLSFNTFVMEDLSLSTELMYTYNAISLDPNADTSYYWRDYFIDLGLTVQKYWFEFFYFGSGLYFRIPFHSFESNAPLIKGSTQFTMGAILEVGVDMKIFENFALKIGTRAYLPFMSYLNIHKNNYTLWTFPIKFIFALEWVL